MWSVDFIEAHTVFTHGEFVATHAGGGRRSKRTSNNLIVNRCPQICPPPKVQENSATFWPTLIIVSPVC